MKKAIIVLLLMIFAAMLNMSVSYVPVAEGDVQPHIFGIVTDIEGGPLKGVEVTAKCGSMGNNLYRIVSPNTWTDENGRFNLPVDFPDISYDVTFRYMYNNSREMKIIPAKSEALKIQLEVKTSKILRGIVVNSSDLSPVAGATVRYFGEYQKFTLERTTDEKGQFEFTQLPFSEFQGVIYAQLNEQVSMASRVNYQGNNLDNLELKLDKGAELWGIVKSESTNKPIKNCIVTITTFYLSGYSMQTTTDANGIYRFSNLPPAEYKVTAQNEDYLQYEKNPFSSAGTRYLSSGQKVQNNFKLKKRVRFEGKVVDSKGKPVKGAVVAIDEAHISENQFSPFVVHTDEKGNFSITTGRIDTTPKPKLEGIDALKQLVKGYFTKRPVGEDAIEAFSSTGGYGRFQFAPYWEGDIIKGVTIKLNGMIRVQGKVTDPNGNPVKDVRIYDETGFYASAKTDEQGEFDLGKLSIRRPDTKQGMIEFLAPRPETSRVINQRVAKIKDSDIKNGETVFYNHKQLNYTIEPGKDINLNVILEPADIITLQGTVLYKNGSPAANTSISLFTGNADKSTWLQTVHPDFGGGRGFTLITDYVICTARTDEKGNWKMVIVRENAEGIKLAYWQENDPSLFSIGVETPDKQTILIQDINIDKDTSEKEINIQLEKNVSPEQNR